MRKPQPQPIGITWPKRSATSGGTSTIGPAAVFRTCGSLGNDTSPTMRTGAMLASVPKPCRASSSSAVELVNPPVPEAVRSHLVAARENGRNQFRIPLGHPADDKEGADDTGLIEIVEQQPGRQADPAGKA